MLFWSANLTNSSGQAEKQLKEEKGVVVLVGLLYSAINVGGRLVPGNRRALGSNLCFWTNPKWTFSIHRQIQKSSDFVQVQIGLTWPEFVLFLKLPPHQKIRSPPSSIKALFSAELGHNGSLFWRVSHRPFTLVSEEETSRSKRSWHIIEILQCVCGGGGG